MDGSGNWRGQNISFNAMGRILEIIVKIKNK